ncbi:MAG: hypothetical protein ACTSP4_00130 [Candidatus Hodarchaeales archaeon]
MKLGKFVTVAVFLSFGIYAALQMYSSFIDEYLAEWLGKSQTEIWTATFLVVMSFAWVVYAGNKGKQSL